MSFSQYDTTIFERAGNEFILSQRFRHFCYKFIGTFRLTGEMISINVLLQVLPRPLAYIFFFVNYLVVAVLFFLVVKQLREPRSQQCEDLDLTDIMDSEKKLVNRIDHSYIFLIVLVIFSFVFLFAIWNENLEKDFLNVYIALLIYLLVFHKPRDAINS